MRNCLQNCRQFSSEDGTLTPDSVSDGEGPTRYRVGDYVRGFGPICIYTVGVTMGFTVLQKFSSHDHITCGVLKHEEHIGTCLYLTNFPWWGLRNFFFKYIMDIDAVFVDSSSASIKE